MADWKSSSKKRRKSTSPDQRRTVAWVSKQAGIASSQGLDSEASKRRIHLLEHNRDMIEQGARQHLKEIGSVDDLVVVVVDADDPAGESLARAFAPEFAPQFEAMRNAGDIPTLTLALAREAATSELAASHPHFAARLAAPPARGAFWLCCVASGGVTLLQAPIPAGLPTLVIPG